MVYWNKEELEELRKANLRWKDLSNEELAEAAEDERLSQGRQLGDHTTLTDDEGTGV